MSKLGKRQPELRVIIGHLHFIQNAFRVHDVVLTDIGIAFHMGALDDKLDTTVFAGRRPDVD